jgi:polyhydroxyalkanoate synthase
LILYGRTLEQTIDRHERATFVKELVVSGGRVPLAMVRKRLVTKDGSTKAPVLLVHGFGQNRYAWHLPARSFANYLARAGYDVFNLDLRGHGRSRHFGAKTPRSVDDYVSEDLPIAVEEVLSHTGKRPPFLVGHSLGGLVSYAAAPKLAGAVAGIASIGSPYHFTRGSFSLQAIGVLFDAMRRAGVPHVGVPVPLYPVGALIRSIRRVADSPFYPIPLRGWHAGALEPHVLDQHLRLAFDRAGIQELRSMFEWGTQKRFGGHTQDYVERFEAMDLPLLVLAGINDDLAPPASVRPAFERSRSRDKTYKTVPLGHIDILVGRDAPFSSWPLVANWMEKRSNAA